MSRPLRVLCLVALVLLIRASAPATADAAGVAWARPVAGAVVRAYAYDPAEPFVRGGHRGVDLAATPGATVRAACGGRVVTARPGQVVTLRCGPWRVTHLPMAHVTAHVGRHVSPGDRLGTLGTSADHHGLHLGVRTAGDRFAYVDPLTFLPPPGHPRLPPPAPAAREPRPLPGLPPPAPAVREPHRLPGLPPPAPAARKPRRLPGLPAPAGAPAAPRLPAPVPHVSSPPLAGGVRVPSATGLAPWPAWAGLALVMCGALGGGVRWRVRARRVRAPARARERVA